MAGVYVGSIWNQRRHKYFVLPSNIPCVYSRHLHASPHIFPPFTWRHVYPEHSQSTHKHFASCLHIFFAYTPAIYMLHLTHSRHLHASPHTLLPLAFKYLGDTQKTFLNVASDFTYYQNTLPPFSPHVPANNVLCMFNTLLVSIHTNLWSKWRECMLVVFEIRGDM